MNEKLEGDLLNWNLNPKDFDGKAHLVREALQKQKRKLGSKRGFDHFERMPAFFQSDRILF